ncbi:MAG: glutaredoxin family protein [Anaerolineae bacterium]|nr:glutaredoxin family protein [Anaerolineae bacterium]
MAVEVNQVEGKDVGDIFMYALSTCVWCRRTKALLNELGLAYRYVDVDLQQGEDRRKVIEDVSRWNPARSFPTLVVNQERAIVGFDERAIRELAQDD